MSGREPRCEQRIDGELFRTEQRFVALWEQLDTADSCIDTEGCDQVYEELDPLSIEVKTVLKVMFSWGGPSDWLEVKLGSGAGRASIERIAYHFADWFDHAERDVSADECPAVWRAAEYYVEGAGDSLCGQDGRP